MLFLQLFFKISYIPLKKDPQIKAKRILKKMGERKNMPYVNIRVAGTLGKKQKEEICRGVTEVIAKVANKPADSILIFIDEVPHENISSGGTLLQKPS